MPACPLWRPVAGMLFGILLVAGGAAPAGGQSSLIGGGLKQDKNAPVVFQADEIDYDEQLGLTIARGHVEIAQGGQTLLADTVSYNQRTDTVTASGHVSLTQTTGEIIFADFMELRDKMNEAFGTNVRMLLADRSRLAANAARRTQANRTELRRAVYSPCDLCPQDPTAPPVWQLKARQIDHDRELQLVEFRDAVMEIDGWPVFYTPYLSTPDPSVKRASGFLPPTIGSGNTLGAHVTIPYYWVLGPDKDLTLAPRFTTGAGEVLAGEYRQKFSDAELTGVGSINYSNRGVGSTDNTGSAWRGHINATGIWDLDETYRTGFQLQRVSDQTYLLRFGFGNPPLAAMISHAYLQGFEERAQTDVDAWLFQPLLPGLGDSTQPIVLPVANRTWQSEPDGLGGRWSLNANLLNIMREVGTQTRRLSLGTEWDRTFRDGIGGQYKFSASLRGDTYSVSGLSPKSNPDLPSSYFSQMGMPPTEPVGRDLIAARAFPQLGLEWNYPLIRRGETITALIEPLAAAYVAPSGGNRRRIPDEDSLSFEFNDSDLFRANRLPGYDILDTGQRVDYGAKFGLYDRDGGSYRVLIGQSFRAQDNPFFAPGSGAEKRLSDVVGRVVLSPSSYLDLIYRFRLDRSSLDDRTQEIGISGGPQSLRVSGNYLLIPPQQQSDIVTNPVTGQNVLYGKRQQLSFDITARLTQYWSLRGTETINLTNSSTVVNGVTTPPASSSYLYSTFSAIYQDECMAFVGSLTQSGVRSGDVTPGVSVLFSVVFKNLGEIGGTVASISGGALP
jgi:LPS-assembly protein